MYICNWLCFCVVPIREVRQKKAFGKTDCVITLRLHHKRTFLGCMTFLMRLSNMKSPYSDNNSISKHLTWHIRCANKGRVAKNEN